MMTPRILFAFLISKVHLNFPMERSLNRNLDISHANLVTFIMLSYGTMIKITKRKKDYL